MELRYPNRNVEMNIAKEKYLMFIDIETIGTITKLDTCFPFEIGMKVIDIENDKIVKEKSYLIQKFFNNKYLMGSCFSANKYPEYLEKVVNDKRYKTYSAKEISKDLDKLIKKYNIKAMVAHNGKFDYTMIGHYFQEFRVENPLVKIDVLDTMELSKDLTHSKEYENFCIENHSIGNKVDNHIESNFITPSNRVRTTAQAIYSFISNNPNFKESHTGLEDISIEYEIFKYCLSNTIKVALNTAPTWRDYPIVYTD